MEKTICFQITVMLHKKEFRVAFSVMTGFSVLAFVYSGLQQCGADRTMVVSADALFCGNYYSPLWHYFSYIFAFVTALPYSMSYISDRECRVLTPLLSRMSRLRYHLSAMIASFIGNFIIIFFPFLLNLTLCHIALPSNTYFLFGEKGTSNYVGALMGNTLIFSTEHPKIPFLKLFLFSPTLYNIFYVLLLSVLSGILGVFLLSLSFILPGSRSLLFFPVLLGFQFSALATSHSYNRAIENTDIFFTNYTIMDYFAVGGYPGQSFLYLLTVILCLLSFFIIALLIVLIRDEFVGGRIRHDKSRKKSIC